MIKHNRKKFNALFILMDVLIIVASYLIAWAIKFKTNLLKENIGHLGISTYLVGMAILVMLFIALYAMSGIYKTRRMYGKWMEVLQVLRANCIGLGVFILGLYIFHEDDYSRMMMVIFFVLDLIFEVIARVLLRSLLRSIRKKGYNQKHVLLVGYSRTAKSYIDRVRQYPQWGYQIHGMLDDTAKSDAMYRGVKIVGRIENLEQMIIDNDFDEIILTLNLTEYDQLESLVAICERQGVHTKFIPDYNNIFQSRPYTEDVLGLPIINVRRHPLSAPENWIMKRAADLVFGGLALLICAPFMLIIMILIKATSKGPAIYSQTRVGYHNHEFVMYKFRTMKEAKDNSDQTLWTKKSDPRVTRIGKFLRKTSLDELPQLFNVLKGDMSLIGPRPERPYYVEIFKEKIPRYMVKHQVRPGMTGWAQVNGLRGDTSIKKRIEYDLYYIENWSMGMDIKIFIHTIFHGFINKNAY